jgi:hypothetical protein
LCIWVYPINLKFDKIYTVQNYTYVYDTK